MRLKFKMLTIKQVVSQIISEDWFVMIDLKDAYFHICNFPQHRKFLRFAFRGKAYQYRVLPFGQALSPRTFTKCVDVALAPLRLQGIRILNYIDDWLILVQSEQLAVRHRDIVFAHMKGLGLRLGVKGKRNEKWAFQRYRGPPIWAWCGIRPRCRHIFLLLISIRSSWQSREWEKVSHSLWSFFKSCWVWWQLRPTWSLLACCTWNPWSGGSGPQGFPRGVTHFTWSRSRGDAYGL